MNIDPRSSEEYIRDMANNPQERLSVAVRLSAIEPDLCVKLLLEIGSDKSESLEMLRGVGHLLASLAIGRRSLSEFELRNLSGSAYDAYCE